MSIEIKAIVGYVEFDVDGHARTIVLHPVKPPPDSLSFHAGRTVVLLISEGPTRQQAPS